MVGFGVFPVRGLLRWRYTGLTQPPERELETGLENEFLAPEHVLVTPHVPYLKGEAPSRGVQTVDPSPSSGS